MRMTSSGDDLADTADTIILFLLLMLPLAFALYFLVRKLTKPIQHLTTVAKKLGQGRFDSARADNKPVATNEYLSDWF